jgi:hypothetical protein
MAKLSEQLADLSAHAKHAEDAVSAAQKEAHDKVMARREQARAAATATIEKVDRNIKAAVRLAWAKAGRGPPDPCCRYPGGA